MGDVSLVEEIAVALGLGLAGGVGARLVRLSPIVGYLAAGIVIGPFTPGYEADVSTLQQLADIGIIFLMFGVGLHFNLRDLLAVRKVAVPAALVQMLLVTAAGLAAGVLFDLGWKAGLVLGLALSISSTVVVVRALEERGLLSSVHGRVTMGWLVVQDMATVLFLALLPSLASGSARDFLVDGARDLVKAAAFLAVMLFAGARLLPPVLALVARIGSRELFILAVVATAMGVAAGAEAVGLSVALGAFVGGVVVSERETSHQAAADVVPLREAFAVLFFVSVGMLVDPDALRDNVGLVVAAVALTIVGKGFLSVFVAAAFPVPARTALIAGAGLAQIGEFSFIIAREGLDSSLIDEGVYNVILATAAITITLNPITFAGLPALERVAARTGRLWRWANRQGEGPQIEPGLRDHVVIAGYGRVGELAGHVLGQLAIPFVVLDSNLDLSRRLALAGITALWGDAASADVLRLAGVERCRLVLVCVPDESSCLVCVTNVRRLNPGVRTIVRARHGDETAVLRSLGADEVVVPEYEGGLEVMRQALVALGYDQDEALRFSHAVRDIHYGDKV